MYCPLPKLFHGYIESVYLRMKNSKNMWAFGLADSIGKKYVKSHFSGSNVDLRNLRQLSTVVEQLFPHR
jgi:hypothetical protein